ncbi:cyclin-dependent kinase inhibitor 3-like [Salvia hispanica]|uniref:cyclin-dependent kinase inhibitor 3-like n=1 Tax=Salvia hispanica TaxID=49212 RepID=UPI002009C7EA|nr:cyclin-dependent kinase inhibitor 3-like [Salvia hispanica]
MGKCTKKAKMTSDVALTDVSDSHSYLGIRTHTKALPLFQRLPSAAACSLQLRSMQPQNSRRSYGCRGEEYTEIGRHENFSPPHSAQGENNLDSDVPQSSTGAITRTKQACSSRRAQNAYVRIAPPAHELEEFFAREEQLVQRRFAEKYNFDIVKDLALRGRYEWVAVRP